MVSVASARGLTTANVERTAVVVHTGDLSWKQVALRTKWSTKRIFSPTGGGYKNIRWGFRDLGKAHMEGAG